VHSTDRAQTELSHIKGTKLPKDGLYSMTVFESDDSASWLNLFSNATYKANSKGGDEGHIFASANKSETDEKIVVLFSWSSLEQQ